MNKVQFDFAMQNAIKDLAEDSAIIGAHYNKNITEAGKLRADQLNSAYQNYLDKVKTAESKLKVE